MSTTTHLRRDRAHRRGLATFVAFLLLFGFALSASSLAALAKSPKKDAAVSADATQPDSGQPDATAPEDAPADELPAEEAPADEVPADASPAEEAAPTDEAADDAGSSSDANATSAASSDAGSDTKTKTRKDRAAAAAPIGIQQVEGGDISLDYVAAGPFTYDHDTGQGTYPTFGYNDRNIDKDDGVVESLESGDFQCGDFVTFFTQVTVDDGATGTGTIELDYSFGAETTGQPGLGFDDIIEVGLNTPDDGNVGLDGNEVVTLIDETPPGDPSDPGYQQVLGTVEVEGLDGGDVVIVFLIVELTCEPGETPTGNILNQIEAGRVTTPGEEDTINVGQQSVPMKTTGFIPEPAIDIEKTCPAEAAFGEDITFTITIENNGNVDLENIVVMDTVDGNAPVDISDLFADTLAAGTSETQDFVYSPDGTEPDPITNLVTVTATGVGTETEVSDTAECDTDITFESGIAVEKVCPPVAGVGDELTYTITVTNTGDDDLVDLVVTDTVNGHEAVAVPGPTELAAGESIELEFTHTVHEGDGDPLTNSVTATAVGVESEASVTDTFECATDILHPDIDIVKTVSDDTVPVGTTVTYTYVITNTGDTTLFDVTVDDDILGHIGDIPVLEPGQSVTMTKDFVVGEAPVTNVATAEGEDVLGRTVTADDDALVTPVLAETPPPPTPFTGSDASRLAAIALGLFGLGATLVAATRRRRARETA